MPVHDGDKKCMVSPVTACNKDDDLVDRGDDEGNGGGVDNNDSVLAGARRRR